MNFSLKSLIILFVLAIQFNCFGQANLLNAKVPTDVGELTSVQIAANDNTPVDYGYVDDRDVMWSKTIWEIIDLNERVNFALYYPKSNNGLLSTTRKSLFRVLIENIESGNITEIYSDDYFTQKVTYDELEQVLVSRQLSSEGIEKSNAGESVTDDDYDEFKIEADKIEQYRIKGTWYFDKRLGELRYRLLGIAPVAPDVSTLKDSREIQLDALVPLFWVWYPDAREALNSNSVFNVKNSSQPITFDNILNSRRFNAVIYKEENVFEDREVRDYIYEDALRQLLESERIKTQIRDFEQDMWNN